MPSRSRKNKGRAPKTPSLSEKPSKSKKSGSTAGSEANSRCSTPNSTHSNTPVTRSSRRGGIKSAAKKSATTSKKLPQLKLDSDSEKDHAEEFDSDSTPSESDDEFKCDNDFTPDETNPGEEDDEWSSIRPIYPKRPVTPDILFVDDSDIPMYTPPESSTDLPISGNELLKAIGIYEILRHFHVLLRLSPFRFEDFCAALICDDQCNLVAEIHISVLKTLLREEDGNQTWFGPPDTKDSINIQFFFLDAMTWYECCRIYLESNSDLEFRKGLPPLEKGSYFEVKLPERLEILHTLTNLFIASNGVREDILKEGNIRYDDHCRNCHKLGDLLCCETCSAVFHLGCVDPPLPDVPEDDWHCNVCTAHQEVEGVMDCVMDAEKHGLLIRHDSIGIDRHRRKYWLMCRRVVVEGDGQVWYYSSEPAFDELVESLDSEYWEQDLVRELEKIRGEVVRQMTITEKLTTKYKGSRKSVLDDENSKLSTIRTAREEKKRIEEEKRQQEEAERLQKEAEEAERRMKEELEGQKDLERNDGIGDSERHKEEVKKQDDILIDRIDSIEPDKEHGQGDIVQENKSMAVSQEIEHGENSTVTKTETLVTTTDGNSEETLKTEVVTTVTTSMTTTRISKSPVPEIKEVAEIESSEDGGKCGSSKKENLAEDTSGSVTKTMLVVNKDGTRTLLTVVTNSAGTEKNDEFNSGANSPSSIEATENTEDKRRISTRSKTGSLVPKNLNDYVTTTKGSLMKAVQKMQADTHTTEEVVTIVEKDDNQIKMTRSRTLQQAQSIQLSVYFKLGEENSYKNYSNQYSTYPLALNKHQHNEERDRKRQLSHKFSLTQLSEFKWSGSIHGSKSLTIATLRNALTALENNIPSPFLHPNWHNHRQNWVKIVNLCSEPRHFAQALSYLELVIKPVLFNPAWHEALGHIRLARNTLQDRDLEKKKDRELEKLAKKTKEKEEEELDRTKWCKYTLGLKHQVWKQKGEEYRIVHGDGWQWLSSTRNYRFEPQMECGLRAVFKKLQVRRTKILDAKIEELSHMKKDDEDITDDEDEAKELKLEEKKLEIEKSVEVKEEEMDVKKEEIEMKDEIPEVKVEDVEKISRKETSEDVKVDEILEVKVEDVEKIGPKEPSEHVEVKGEDVKVKCEDEIKEEKIDVEPENKTNNKITDLVESNQDLVVKIAKKRNTPSPPKYQLKPEDYVFLDTISAKNVTEEEKESGVINVSEAIRLHRHYPKMSKPYSKLDHLLERRQKQWMVEQRQKMIIDQVLLKYRVQNLQKKQALQDKNVETKEKEENINKNDTAKTDKLSTNKNIATADDESSVMEVDEANMGMTGIADLDDSRSQSEDTSSQFSRNSPTPPPPLPYSCYSVLCRCRGEISFKNPPRGCYSATCSYEQRQQLLQSLKERNAQSELSCRKRVKLSNRVDITLDNSNDLPNGLLDSLESGDEAEEIEPKKPKIDDNTNQNTQEKDNFQKNFESFLKKGNDDSEKMKDDSTANEKNISDSVNKAKGEDSDCPISIEDTDDSNDGKTDKSESAKISKDANDKGTQQDTDKQDNDNNEGMKSSDEKDSGENENKELSETVDNLTREKTKTKEPGKAGDDKKTEVTKVAKIEPDGKSFMLGDQRLPLIEQNDEELHKQAKKYVVTIDNLTFTNIMHGGKLQLTPAVIPELELKRYMVGKTQYQLTLHRFAKGGRTANRGRFILKKGAIPPVHKFLTKTGKKSLFVLEKYDLHQLSRRSGKREVPGFKYECKMNNVGWIYPCPRPHFKTCWRYRSQSIRSLAAAALQLRILWSCLRWDDLSLKPPQGGQYTVTTDEEVVTTEVIKRKDVGSYGLRSEYLVRKIVVPLNVPEEPRRDYTPIRSGLRERKRADSPKQREPSMTETWTPEERLEIWEIKWFGEKVEKSISVIQEAANRQLLEKQHKEEQHKKHEDFKSKIEEQLKQQRQAMQQKRLQEIQAKKDGSTPPFIIKKIQGANSTGNSSVASVHVISTSSSGSSVLKVSKPLPTMASNTTVITRLIQPKNIVAGTTSKGSGVVQISTPTVAIRPKVQTTAAIAGVVTTPKATPAVRAIAPNIVSAQLKTNEVVTKPATPGGQVQNLRIMQLPNGQVQVQGLMPGQQLVRQPDGKLQLITAKSNTQLSQVGSTTPQTPVQVQAASVSPTAGQSGIKVIRQAPPVVVQQQKQQSPVIQVQSQPTSHVTIQQKPPAQTNQQAKPAVNVTSQANSPRLIQIQLPGQPPQQVLIQGNQLQALQALQQQKAQGGQVQSHVVQNQAGKVVIQKAGMAVGQNVHTSPAAGSAQSGIITSPQANPAVSVTPPRILNSLVQGQQSPTVLTSAIASQLGNLGPNPVLVRTPSGQIGILRPQVNTNSTPAKSQIQLNQPRASLQASTVSPPAGSSLLKKTDGSSKTVAPNVIQQVLQRAMLQNEDPEIQAKIQALQKNLVSTDSPSSSLSSLSVHTHSLSRNRKDKELDTEWEVDSGRLAPALKERVVKGTKSEIIGKIKTNWPKSKEEMEDQTRQAICSSVIKSIIDKIEKKEKADLRAQKKTIVAEEKREKARSSQLSANLFKQKESLKTDMMRKRALMEKTIQQEVQHDIKCVKRKVKKQEKQKVFYYKRKKKRSNEIKEVRRKISGKPTLVGKASVINIQEQLQENKTLEEKVQLQQLVSQQQQQRKQEAAQKRKRRRDSSADFDQNNALVSPGSVTDISIPSLEATASSQIRTEECTSGASSRKKRKVISTGGESSRKLYCVCKTPYDQSKFYVGCDLCSNWFHGRCINITESQARYLDSYVCDDCKVQAQGTNEELYCICRTPYDESKFYIGCDHCNDWFHGSCVGITKSEADSIDTYLCPRCQESASTNSLVNERVIDEDHWELLMDILHSLKIHKMSWPFREPVDPNEVPDYYDVIKEPMDLSTIERKLDTRRYVRFGDFIKDIMRVFDNCRFYNPSDTPFYKCAEVLETQFVQSIKNLEDTL